MIKKNMQVKIKYTLDRIMSLLVIILMMPVFLLIYIIIRIDSKGPGFFVQERVGLDGRLFRLYKFRTMVVGASQVGDGIYVGGENDPRITRAGRVLRKLSLDELPQLFNILKGEMSFVGPRPTLKYQVDRYTDRQRRRLEMKPGVTGLAQVSGRNAIPWSERIEYDIRYIDGYSIFLDAKILLKTIATLFKGEEIYGALDDLNRQPPETEPAALSGEKQEDAWTAGHER